MSAGLLLVLLAECWGRRTEASAGFGARVSVVGGACGTLGTRTATERHHDARKGVGAPAFKKKETERSSLHIHCHDVFESPP